MSNTVKTVTFEGYGQKLKNSITSSEQVGVWTDCLMVSTEYDDEPRLVKHNLPRLFENKKYKITVTIEEI